MPPGISTRSTTIKKKIRPSSASASLQTHPQYTSGLYDNNVRPSTAAAGGSSVPGQRPKTQAGGPKHYAPKTTPGSEPQAKPQRRLTLGTVEGIAELEAACRHRGFNIHLGLGQARRGKVGKCIILQSFLSGCHGERVCLHRSAGHMAEIDFRFPLCEQIS